MKKVIEPVKNSLHTPLLFLCAVCLLCTSCKNEEEKYAHYIQRGDTLYEQADFVKARLEYKNAAKVQPSSAQVIYKLGLIEEAEGNYQSALSAFLTAEQQSEEFEPVLIKIAEFFIIAQQYEEATKRITAILEINPENAQALALRGSIFLKQQAMRQARRDVDDALRFDPQNTIAHSVLSGIYIAQGHPDKALSTLKNAIALNPQELSYYLLKATIYSEQDNVDAVTDVYQTMFVRFPDEVRFRYDLANILVKFSRPQAAKEVYQSAIKAFPDNHDAKQRFIGFVEDEEGIAPAKQEIKDFIATNPDDKIFALWLAALYARSGEHTQAVSTLESVIGTNLDDWVDLSAKTALAELQLSQGDIEIAKNLIDIVLDEEVNNLDALFLKANLAFIEGDYRKAISDFRGILSQDSSYLKASRMLAETLLLQGRIDLAIDRLIQALKTNAGDRSTLVRLAQLYSLRGESETGLGMLEKITDLNPDYAVAWESVARIALEIGEASTAADAIARLLELETDSLMAQLLQARLDQQDGKTGVAIAALKAIIDRNVSAPIAAFALSTLLEVSETKSQLKDVQMFLSGRDDHNSASLTVLGAIQMQMGDEQAAEVSFRNAIAQQPNSQDPYVALANLMVKQTQDSAAIAILEVAEKADASEIKASMMKAGILIKQGDVNRAIEIYGSILARNDNVDTAANNMAQLIADYKYNDSNVLEKARLSAERFVNSNNPDYLDTLGWVYYRSDLSVQAQPFLAKAVALLDPPKSQVDYHYGAVLLENGDYEQAEFYLRRATELVHTPYHGLDVAKALLEGLKINSPID